MTAGRCQDLCRPDDLQVKAHAGYQIVGFDLEFGTRCEAAY